MIIYNFTKRQSRYFTVSDSSRRFAPETTAFLFPGCWVRLGMGRSLAENFNTAAELFKKADTLMGYSLSRLMWEGPAEKLRDSANTQPASFLASMAGFLVLQKLKLRPAAFAGRSLGDITAAVAAGAISFDAGMLLVKANGELFDKTCRENPGQMAVILEISAGKVKKICRTAEKKSHQPCVIASLNTPSNTVISGGNKSVEEAVNLAQKEGARILRLPMPGPFHSPLMSCAVSRFRRLLGEIGIAATETAIVGDFSCGKQIRSPGDLRRLLISQITDCVNWRERVRVLSGMGISNFVEIGVSQGMAKIAAELTPGSSAHTVECAQDIEQLLGRMETAG